MIRALLVAAILLVGCATETPANYKTIKLVASAPKAGHVHGLIEANTPQTAGMTKRGIDFECPGQYEFKQGPSEYKMYLDTFPPQIDLKVYVDGKELKRGSDCTWSGGENTTAELIFSVH